MELVYTRRSWKYRVEAPFRYVFPKQFWLRDGDGNYIDDILVVANGFATLGHNHVDIKPGFCWDGASGPTVDTLNSQVPSLVHDVICQAVAEKQIHHDNRKRGDRIFRHLLKQDAIVNGKLIKKMKRLRRWFWYTAVRWQGDHPVPGV